VTQTLTAIAVGTVLALATMLVLDATPAYAYNTWNDHRLWSGVGDYGYNNQYYYVDGSAGAYLGTATAAMDDWIYTTERTGITTPISFLRTTYRPASIIDVFQINYVAPWWGFTTHYNGDAEIEPTDGNWSWTLVQLDGAFAQCRNQQGVIAHEMGHALGLAHVDTMSSVMYVDIAYTSVTAAVADDLYGINHLYP
jgi:hypothetical protein